MASVRLSPKADRMVFASSRGSTTANLYQKTTSGTGKDELLVANDNHKQPTQWSHDGRFIVYFENDKAGAVYLPEK